MSLDKFENILNNSQYSEELKTKLQEFYNLLNEEGQNYLTENLESIVNESSD